MDGKRSSTTTSAAMVAWIDDVLMEILLHLPTRTLIRFKSVSKHWYALISAASFSHLHTLRHHRSKPQTSFLLRASPSQFFYFSPTSEKFFQFHFNCAEPTILQSCNGLLLLESRNPSSSHTVYYVYNPTTGKSRVLLIDENECLLRLCLAFDPSKSPHYKVICFKSTSYSIHCTEIQVFDSETQSWKCLDKVFSTPLVTKLKNGVYWNDAIYWRTSIGIFPFHIEKGNFELPVEIFGIKCQSGVTLNMNYLMELGGHMHYIVHCQDVGNYLLVFEVKKDGRGWILIDYVNFDRNTAFSGAVSCSKISFMGAYISVERKEESNLVLHVPGKIMAYWFHDRSFEELLDLRAQTFYREGRLQFGYNDAFQFIESLAPV